MSKQKVPNSSKKTKKQARFSRAGLKQRAQFRQERKIEARKSHKKISGSFRLLADCLSFMRQHWKIFGGIALVYLILALVLVGARGSGVEVDSMRKQLGDTFGGGTGQIGANLSLFGLIASNSGSASSEAGSTYQTIVFLLVSLATIWALRQLMAGHKISVRDAFYKGIYPLVPMVFVLLVIGLQFVPLLLAGFLFNVGFGNGVAVGAVEQAVWIVVVGLLVLLSLYLICSSIFALYVVTLPDMRPMTALRTARNLVRFRRWTVGRKLLFLPLVLGVIGLVVTTPFIWLLPAAAGWAFLVFSLFALILAHTYVYSLYRELL